MRIQVRIPTESDHLFRCNPIAEAVALTDLIPGT